MKASVSSVGQEAGIQTPQNTVVELVFCGKKNMFDYVFCIINFFIAVIQIFIRFSYILFGTGTLFLVILHIVSLSK